METKQPPKPAFPLLMMLALASALGVAVAIALAGIAMLLAAPAYAEEGSLLLKRDGTVAKAPLLFAETESQEDGPIVRTRVREGFHNPFAERVAAVYRYPLPAHALLESLTLTLPSEEPASAVPAARHAVLMLSMQPALAEQSAEIGPQETVLVELEYVQVRRYDRTLRGWRLLTAR